MEKGEIEIRFRNDYGEFTERFSGIEPLKAFTPRIPHVKPADVRQASTSPGVEYHGPASIPPSAPGQELVSIRISDGRLELRYVEFLVERGDDETRLALFEFAARCAARTPATDPCPRYRTIPGHHHMTVALDTGQLAYFPMPALLRVAA